MIRYNNAHIRRKHILQFKEIRRLLTGFNRTSFKSNRYLQTGGVVCGVFLQGGVLRHQLGHIQEQDLLRHAGAHVYWGVGAGVHLGGGLRRVLQINELRRVEGRRGDAGACWQGTFGRTSRFHSYRGA
jgi:hypothetical protein